MIWEHVRCLSPRESSAECRIMCHKKWYFYFHTKHLITITTILTKRQHKRKIHLVIGQWVNFQYTIHFFQLQTYKVCSKSKQHKYMRNELLGTYCWQFTIIITFETSFSIVHRANITIIITYKAELLIIHKFKKYNHNNVWDNNFLETFTGYKK
jgi:hypothetical protein